MSGRDVAGLIGVGILTVGIFAMGVSAFTLLFPAKPRDFASPADEQDATTKVNGRPCQSAMSRSDFEHTHVCTRARAHQGDHECQCGVTWARARFVTQQTPPARETPTGSGPRAA